MRVNVHLAQQSLESLVLLHNFEFGVLLEDADCHLEACILDGLRVDLLVDFGKCHDTVLQGLVEGSVRVARYLMVLDCLPHPKCLFLHLLQPFINPNERLVLFLLPHAVIAIV